MGEIRRELTYIAFGGGVQSTALLIASALGIRGIPKADVAVFSDTQAEIKATYDHVDRMTKWGEEHGIPVEITTAGSLEDDVLVGVKNSQVSIPGFIKNEDGSRGIQRRQCTYDYKLIPLQKKVRELCGLRKGQRAKGVLRVKTMLGISTDEASRMKPSRVEWMENTFPLIDAGMSRDDCLRLIEEHGIPRPPRSACYFCPFHRRPYWRWLKTNHPEEWRKAIAFDEKFRSSRPQLVGESYLVDNLIPLSEYDVGQDEGDGREGFGNECEGHCGI